MADLVGDDTPGAFCAHPTLPPWMAAYLEAFHQAFLERNNTLAAYRLARLAADDAAASLVGQMKRRSLHPTVLLDIWRRRDLRADLRRIVRNVRKKNDVTWQDFRSYLDEAMDDEGRHREFLMALLLAKLAQEATRSHVTKGASLARLAVKERQTAEALRTQGFPDDAARHMRQADMHLSRARKIAEECPDEVLEELIWKVRSWSWELGFLGYGLAANLVSAALNRPITRGQARYRIPRWRARHLIEFPSK